MLDCMAVTLATYPSVFSSFMGWPPIRGTGRTVEVPSIEPTADDYVVLTTNSAQQFEDLLVLIGRSDLLAQAGLVGAMVEHGFVDDDSLGVARDDLRSALDVLRADPRVAPDRVGLWFFSAGGLLMGSFLDPAPDGVRAVAGTYAAVDEPDLAGTDLVQATETAPISSVPLLLVRPEHDFDWIAVGTDDLLARCAAADRAVDVIDVPGVRHGFETVDDTDPGEG